MKPPDIKRLLLGYLAEATGKPTVSTRPENAATGTASPAEFIRVVATGGQGRSNRVIQHVQFTIDAYSTSNQNAWLLAASVDEAMYRLPQSALPVSRVQGNTPAESPDPDTASARYTATYQLTTLCL